jgi:nanoRNase/pAp phosphatase (c-di-AMP/oligoRNAs hydrolase)
MRLLTRSDFDGLVCAVLLTEKGVVDSYEFVHPKDVQDGKVPVSGNDVLANVPHAAGCGLWFDHHASEQERLEMTGKLDFEGDSRAAPSAAQVIWDFYGGEATFGARFLPLLEAVNKTDSGDLSRDEILEPEGWILLSFMMDPRTGLGRFKDYRISNYQLMMDMIRYCRTMTVDDILDIEDVKERTGRYGKQQTLFQEMLKRNTHVDGNVLVVDLMREEMIYAGNRFLVYALFPAQNVEVRVMWGRDKRNVVFAVGHSILNRTCETDIGSLMLEFGGGGHPKVGTCQVDVEIWRDTLDRIMERLRQGG